MLDHKRRERWGEKKKHAPHSSLTGPQVSSKVTNLIGEILADYCADQGAPGGLVQPLCCTPPTQKPPSGGLGETQAAVSVGRGLLGMHGAQSWAVIHQVRLVILSFRSKGSGSHPGAKSRLLPAFI